MTASLWAEVSITQVKGKVELMLPGSQSWVKASDGAEIPANTRISTGFNSTAVLVVNRDTRVNLKALTRIQLEEAIAQNDGSQNTRLLLGSGRIQADVKKKEGSFHDFRVNSPVATAAVRGTQFDMSPRKLKVLEGAVRFFAGGYGFTIQRGQDAQVTVIGSSIGIDSPTGAAINSRKVQTNTGSTDGDIIVNNTSSSSSNIGSAYIQLK